MLFLTALAGAEWTDTPTGLALDKLSSFRLTKLRDGVLMGKNAHMKFDDVLVTVDGAEAVLRGVTRAGKAWEVRMYYSSLDGVFRGDLDANGTPDYVFFGVGPFANGRLAPLGWLTILLRDRHGAPVPFEAAVYRGDHKRSPQQLLDLDRDGRAELLISKYDEDEWDSRVGPFCSGHWTHRLYQFKNLQLREYYGPIAGLRFPFRHRWKYCCQKCPQQERPWPIHPVQRETRSIPNLKGKVTQVKERPIASVRLASGGSCRDIMPKTVVYDQPKLRQIGFNTGRSTYRSDLLKRIKEENASVRVTGVTQHLTSRNCYAQVLWAAK